MIAQPTPILNGRVPTIPTDEPEGQARSDVAVVGGGLAGLAAAITAARAGRSVTLFEGASSLGGPGRVFPGGGR